MQKTLTALGLLMMVAVFGLVAFLAIRRGMNDDDGPFGPAWAPFTPTTGRYTITFPRRPNENTYPGHAGRPATHVARYTLIHDGEADEEFQVEVTPLSKVDDIEKALDTGLDDDRPSDATEVSRTKISLNGKHPGRAATLQEKGLHRTITIKVREYIVDNQRYMLKCTGVRKDAEIDKFFDSFKVK